MKRLIVCLYLLGVTLLFSQPGISRAEQFRIAIMQDQGGAAQKFKPLLDHLSKKGIQATFISAQDYPAAANLFAVGSVDAMFSGSGIAGIMIIKELAVPIVRPVDKDGHSTYWAVIIAKKGAPKFTGSAEYFAGKRLIFTSLASSGEFYFHSLPGAMQVKTTLIKAMSHGAAVAALDHGQADVAIIKNEVWYKIKDKYPDLEIVGEDKGQNPDGTLIVSKKIPQAFAAKVSDALLAVKNDPSTEARAVRESLGIRGYIKTTSKDFEHTLSLLKKAGVTPSFNFAF